MQNALQPSSRRITFDGTSFVRHTKDFSSSVFSNAVFHWIKNHETLLDYIYKVLKPKGLLICEFGTSGNIATIENAFIKVCQDLGYEYKPKFNFPTTKHFADLLTKKGFIIDKIYDYD